MVNEWTRACWPTVPEKPDGVGSGSVPEKPDATFIYPSTLDGFSGKVVTQPENGAGMEDPEWASIFAKDDHVEEPE
jgi:hypothetical protein